MAIKVKATQEGYFGLERKRRGAQFFISDEKEFSKKWMKKVDESESDETEEEEEAELAPVKGKGKGRAKKKVADPADDESEGDETEAKAGDVI